MTAMLSENNWPPGAAEPRRHAIEKRRVLMGVNDIDPFGAHYLGEPQWTSPIQPGLSPDQMHGEPFIAKLSTQRSDLI
jgi:hypothetical protein